MLLFLCKKINIFAHEKVFKVDNMNEMFELSEDGKVVLRAYLSNTHAVIPEGVTKIGENSFSSSQISSVIIPEGVEEIAFGAFRNCRYLLKVQLPNSLRIIGQQAFAATGLVSLHIPDGVTEIGLAAFFNSRDLRSISIPSTVKKMVDPFAGVMLEEAHIYVRDLDLFNAIDCSYCKRLYVPSEMLEAYKQHPIFRRVEHIGEIGNGDVVLFLRGYKRIELF